MLLLPAIAWGCTVPLGVMALLKTGGWLNSWHSLVLWFPPVLVALFTAGRPFHFQRWLQLGGVVTAAALACARVITAPTLPLRPQVNHYHVGSGIAARLPGQVWFPLHPIITLYSDGCFYHDEDGFYERKVARMGIALDHAAAHLPPKMHTIAFFTEWSDWGIARNMLPSNARPVFVGAWALWSAPAVEPPR
jgi:hypothetical protein